MMQGYHANLKGVLAMESCQCQGIEVKFDQEYVDKKLAKYREKGPKKTTVQLMEALKSGDIQGMSLLDIGGGVGDIQHGLLKAGVGQALNVEGSTAYAEACKEEAIRQGHADKIKHLQGNFVDLAGDVPQADIVTLDRVICCYDDMPTLVNLSAQKAKKFYAVVYPRDQWWVKVVNEIYYNFRNWINEIRCATMYIPPRQWKLKSKRTVSNALFIVIWAGGRLRCFPGNKPDLNVGIFI